MDEVRLVGVHLRYRRGPIVLAGVDLELAPGRPVVVVGANGSGKSTLLRVAAGCSWPTTGTVTGRPRSVGYVPDRFPSQLRMPATSYLRHMAAMHRADAGAAAGEAAALSRELGFSGDLSSPMAQLSKGNAQKIALAQALCSGARLLVLDEPWSGLDLMAAPVLTDYIVRAAAAGAAVLITDHTRTADRIPRRRVLRLDAGELRPTDQGDGRTPHPENRETVRVVLAHTQARQLAEQLAAAHVVEIGRASVTIDVSPDASDALLHAALRWGASIRSVHRLPAAPPGRDPTGRRRSRRLP